MSRIVSPTPIVITITVNEVTNAVTFASSRDIDFTAIIAIFCNIELQMLKDHAIQQRRNATSGFDHDGNAIPPVVPVKGS